MKVFLPNENIKTFHHKLLIWVSAYDTLSNRDQYVTQQLIMARNICESSNPHSFIQLFIGTCSRNWNTSDSLRNFQKRNSYEIIYL